jgi:hypothetical protein
MGKTKRIIISGLIVLNLVLMGLLLHTNMPTAQAQTFKDTDYLVTSVTIGTDVEAIVIVDLASQNMLTLYWDRNGNRIAPVGRPRDLNQDFRSGR